MQRDRKKNFMKHKTSSSNVFRNVQFRQRWTKFKNIDKKTKSFSKMTADGSIITIFVYIWLVTRPSLFPFDFYLVKLAVKIAVTTSGIRMIYFIWCLSSSRKSAGSLSVRRVPVSHLCPRLLDDQARTDAQGGGTPAGTAARYSETQRRLPLSAVSFGEETNTRHVGILVQWEIGLVLQFWFLCTG